MFDHENTPRYIDLDKYSEVSLVPHGLPQLLDFEVDWKKARAAGRTRDGKVRFFEEYPKVDAQGAPLVDGKGRPRLGLRFLFKNENGEYVGTDGRPPSNPPVDPARVYEVPPDKFLDPWLDQWTPVPFFRLSANNLGDGDDAVDPGPSNWARARLTRGDAPDIVKIVLAFDMQVEPGRAGGVYGALSDSDVEGQRRFRLAWEPGELVGREGGPPVFLDADWVRNWLRRVYNRSNKPKNDGRREYLAYYLTMLEWLGRALRGLRVFPTAPGAQPVDATLVLDIGNSRSTGLLVELDPHLPVASLEASTFYRLQLRDLDQPQFAHTRPFDTRVEFSRADFGDPDDEATMGSGRRSPAFVWASPVRTGQEATRLATRAGNNEGRTGMSSPKRYLWNEKRFLDTWRFNTRGTASPNVTAGPLATLVNSSGTPLCCLDDPVVSQHKVLNKQDRNPATEARFSRSSLMMFLLAEILTQALATINTPANRLHMQGGNANRPRRLDQIVFTLPDGMPMAEQRIYRRWTRWAVRVLWQCLGWEADAQRPGDGDADGGDYRRMPRIRCNWGEANCTQIIFLYNEWRKLMKQTDWFFALYGRQRAFCGRQRQPGDGTPSIRVASIDIGGGTSDLCITTFAYRSDKKTSAHIVPYPEFHDSCNFAGDDVVLEVIREHVRPALIEAMREAGIANPDTAFAELFGNKIMAATGRSPAETAIRRARFVRQVMVPAALCALAYYEQSYPSGGGAEPFRFRDFFELPPAAPNAEEETEKRKTPPWERHPAPGPGVVDHVEDYVRDHAARPAPVSAGDDGNNGTEFDLLDASILIDPKAVHKTVLTNMNKILHSFCEVINLYGCDALLLTGRPSRWHAIVETIIEFMPLPPSRIIPMYKYQVGGWYPFENTDSDPETADAKNRHARISDPKTTVVVGAILCAVAENKLEGFALDAGELYLASTARFIGELQGKDAKLKNDKVWFKVDTQRRERHSMPPYEVEVMGSMSIGYRQLEVEDWHATRFYALTRVGGDNDQNTGRKLKVRLSFTVSGSDQPIYDPNTPELNVVGAGEGEFEIIQVQDEQGRTLDKDILDIHLQTMRLEEGFWMDTGILLEDE